MPGAEVFRVIRRMVEPPRYAQATDRELLTRYLSDRDEEAFEVLTRRHAGLVQLAVAGVLTDPNDIDDAFQATFLVLVRRARGTEWRAGLGPWLYGVAHRVAVKLRAKALRRPGPLGDTEPAGRPDRPDACWRDVCDQLHAELDRLPDRYRLPLLLCYLEGHTRDEAAAALGLSVGAVKGRVKRGCDLLRRRLGRRGVTLSAGLMAAVAATHPVGAVEPAVAAILRGACSPRAFALAREMTMRSALWKAAAGVAAAAVLVGVGTGLIAAGSGGGAAPPEKTSAEPVAPPSGRALALQYVPPNAAVLVHANVSAIWGGPLGKSSRTAEPKFTADLAAAAKDLFGTTPDGLESITLYWPRLKAEPGSEEQLGFVVAFRAPFNKDAVATGFGRLLPKRVKSSVHAVSDRVAVVLVGLDDRYAKPRAADATGPLAPAIREAAGNRHLMVLGINPAHLPDELRRESDVPVLRALLPIARAESVVAILDQDKALSFEVRVKAATPAKAVEAEKSLGFLATGLRQQLADLAERTDKEPGSKELAAVSRAVVAGLAGAKFSTDGAETRARVTLPADLPYIAVITTGMAQARVASVQTQSVNNLKQIALAMHNYASVNGDTLPPAAIVDKAGKPLLSWRVAILPYLEQQKLYKEFKLDEPWDSEHNKKLLEKMPKIYAVPEDAGAKPGETRYRVFVGNGAGFDPVVGHKFTDITDGTSNTLMVVTAATAVPWTKPDELAFDPEKDMSKLLGPVANSGFQAAFFDGSVRIFPKLPPAKTLNALITRAGGEVVDLNAP